MTERNISIFHYSTERQKKLVCGSNSHYWEAEDLLKKKQEIGNKAMRGKKKWGKNECEIKELRIIEMMEKNERARNEIRGKDKIKKMRKKEMMKKTKEETEMRKIRIRGKEWMKKE